MKKILLIFIAIFSISFSNTEADERLAKILGELNTVAENNVELSHNNEITLREEIIEFAKDKLELPYVWGATGPTKFDCSGFVGYIFSEKTDVKLPRVSRDMANYNDKKNIDDIEVGDLLFFNTSSKGNTINHVGIYMGNGNFIHASSAQKKVTVSSIDDNFYKKSFKWAISPFK